MINLILVLKEREIESGRLVIRVLNVQYEGLVYVREKILYIESVWVLI